MPQTVTEIADNAIIEIKVNKSFYFMVKNLGFTLFKLMSQEESQIFSDLMQKKDNNLLPDYNTLSQPQQNFYTIMLLLAEIEKEAIKNNLTQSKEVLMPEDEGFNPETIQKDFDIPDSTTQD
jgi:hypothetical protein